MLLFLPLIPLIVAAKVQLEPRNRAALLGSDASFNCSVKVPWVAMTWLLNGGVVLTISIDHGVLENRPRFTAVNYTTNGEYKWEFIIKNVTRQDSGVITCDVQNIQSERANLSVQESGTVGIKGGNITVRQGDQAAFVCAASGWFPEPHVSWSINGTMADTEDYNTTSEAAGTLLNSTSTLTISAVDSVQVQCLAKVPALFTPETSSVFLIVDKTESNHQIDRTVLIAVTVSFSLAALIVLLIIGIILCCRRKKEKKSNYQEEAVKHRQNAKESDGTDNPTYITDGHMSHPSNSNGTNPNQIPDVSQTSSSQQNGFKKDVGTTPTKFRHATIV